MIAGNEHWAVQYIGIPWQQGAQGPHAFNCWFFFRHVQMKHFGRDVPVVDVEQLDMAAMHRVASAGNWRRVETPLEGDAVLMPRPDELHIGLWCNANGGGVLHCARGFGVVLQRPAAVALDGWPTMEFWSAR